MSQDTILCAFGARKNKEPKSERRPGFVRCLFGVASGTHSRVIRSPFSGMLRGDDARR